VETFEFGEFWFLFCLVVGTHIVESVGRSGQVSYKLLAHISRARAGKGLRDVRLEMISPQFGFECLSVIYGLVHID
jgi:hypothetical protein